MKIQKKKYKVQFGNGFYEFEIASIRVKPKEKVLVKRSFKHKEETK